MIDSKLPEILANVLLYRYAYGTKPLFTELLKKLLEQNPLKFDLSSSHPFYEYKIKNFLTDIALGMTPETIWKGVYDATGGIIIVKEDGDIVCYHIYNRNEFQDYLLFNTKLNQTSTTRYDWGYLYLQNGIPHIKLNICVRFID
jgi:type II restriction enzyme